MRAPALGAMPEPAKDDRDARKLPQPTLSVLSTAMIFDDAVYLSEALNLPINQNEDDVDAELALLARESGVQDPYRFLCSPHDVSRALSTETLDSDRRSSLSVHSQETQSTSFTSAPSRTSRDHICNTERPAAQRIPPKLARAGRSTDGEGLRAGLSAAAENYDQTAESAMPGVQQKRSTSTLSVTQSVLSDSSSLSSPAPRRKRGSGLFGMFRKDSSSCTSQSHHGHHGRVRSPKLVCGHSLSIYAIRIHIQESLQRGAQAVPSCCGKPLPREILELVMAKEEAYLITDRAIQSPDMGSSRDSGYGEKSISFIDLSRSVETTSKPATSISLPVTPPSRRRHEAINIDSALAHEAFKSFRMQEKEQFERVSAFECNQRKALTAHHQCSLKRLAAQHETNKDQKMEQHAHDLEHLEELQIMAEHDLRKAHALETQNVATALKHMEAYCLGSSQSHLDHAHVVTEDDFRKLDRQRMTQQNLTRKHESAINVLRARQERETRTRLQKQETELDLMDADFERKKANEEAEYRKELERLDALIEARRKRLLQRWDLRFEMWRRDWEDQHGTTIKGQLEHENWPQRTTNTMIPIPESSSLAPYVQATA